MQQILNQQQGCQHLGFDVTGDHQVSIDGLLEDNYALSVFSYVAGDYREERDNKPGTSYSLKADCGRIQ